MAACRRARRRAQGYSEFSSRYPFKNSVAGRGNSQGLVPTPARLPDPSSRNGSRRARSQTSVTAATPDVRPVSRSSQGGSSVGSPLPSELTPSEFKWSWSRRRPSAFRPSASAGRAAGEKRVPQPAAHPPEDRAAHAGRARRRRSRPREARGARAPRAAALAALTGSCRRRRARGCTRRRRARARGGGAARGRRPAAARLAPPGVALHRAAPRLPAAPRRHRRRHDALGPPRDPPRASLGVHRGVDRISYAVVLARSVRRWEAAAAAHSWRAWQLFRHLEAAWRLREAHTRGVLHRTLSLLAWRRGAAPGGGARAPPARARMRRRPRSASHCTRSSAPSPPPRSSERCCGSRSATNPPRPTDSRCSGRCAAWAASTRVATLRKRLLASGLASTRLHSAERALASWRGHATWRRRRSRRLERGVAHWRLRAASRVVDAWTAHAATRPRLAAAAAHARERAIAVAYAAWAARAAPARPLQALAERRRRREAIDAYGAWALGAHEAARWRRSCAWRRRPTARRAGCSCAGVRLRSWARCSGAPTPIGAGV